ncbi:L,D-transpeptidase family protein [Desulforamulus aquiferis]|uniref:L,D-transpeptidase family protein n=1 Tax=Desulforamulus aquiferis TaxID=1397668 RepID=A0AAW7ZF14_9FIRM|nr:L,D-transpeptidase family protein [Desulforamulus aquiferis]MDO7788075.1 L,D-transpeptidase family protein [Desulforamulus aquiferis]
MSKINFYRAGMELVIDPASRQLSVYMGGQLSKAYPIAVGKPSTPTPAGNYKVINKVINPGGVLGSRWMGLNIPGGNYGIHGTNNPASIGNKVSLGCIRMHNKNVEELFPQVPVGTPVEVRSIKGYNQKSVPASNPNVDTGTGPPLDHSVYIVQPGDTLWKIAAKFNVTLDAIIESNNLTNPNILQVGQQINIPR